MSAGDGAQIDAFPIGSDVSDTEDPDHTHMEKANSNENYPVNDSSRYSSAANLSSEPDSAVGKVKRKILIVGAGVAGLVFALSIKRAAAATNLNLIPIVYERSASFDIHKESYMIELGLGRLIDADTKELIVQWPPEGPDLLFSNVDDNPLPPMLAIRKVDLIRLLLKALAGVGCDDVIKEAAFQPSCANNSDIASEEVIGVAGDLAKGDWFKAEKWRRMLNEVNIGYEFLSYTISPSTGVVTANFNSGTSEWSETADMLIGADGVQSKVRTQMNDSKTGVRFAGAAIFSGITRTHITPPDAPDSFPNGKEIEDLTRNDIGTFCPDGSAISVVGGGYAFGCIPLGNGMIGWNLVCSQTEPGQHVEKIVLGKTKDALSEVLRENPRSSIMMGMTPRATSIAALAKSDTEPRRFSDSTAILTFEASLKDHFEAPLSNSANGSRTSVFLDKIGNMEKAPLTGQELRHLALKLSMNSFLPHPCHALMARSDPTSLNITDVIDLSDESLLSYTSKAHPGRVMVIGDAAHAVAANAHGSVGASLAITDATLLAKLIARHLSHTSTRSDSLSFAKISQEFDAARTGVCAAAVKEARNESGYGRVENRLMRSLVSWSKKWQPATWAVSSYETMLTRGGLGDEYLEPSLAPK